MRVYIANRVLSGFSVILSLILFGTCIWTLISLLLQDTSQKTCSESQQRFKYEYPEELQMCNSSTHAPKPSPSLTDENKSSSPLTLQNRTFPGEEDAVVVESDEGRHNDSSKLHQFLIKFDKMDSTFRTFTIICLSLVSFSSLVQIILSSVLIFSPRHKVSSRSRRVVIVLFIVFILYLVGFAWPLAYKRGGNDDEDDDSSYQSMSTLNSAIMDFFHNFEWSKVVRDLNFYYIQLFFNSLFLFFYMVVTCCLLRCAEYDEYEP